MTKTNLLRLYLATILALPIMLGQACAPTPDDETALSENDSGSNDQRAGNEQVWNDGALQQQCGTRNVSSVPGPGFVEAATLDFESDVQPGESPLMKVMFPSVLCQPDLDFDAVSMLYEVDATGTVIAIHTLMEMSGRPIYMSTAPTMGQWFTVEDGCLKLNYDLPDVDLPDDDLPDLDPPEISQGPCPAGQLAIDRQGLVVGEPNGPYVCVQADNAPSCRSCWQENGVWYEENEVSGTYIALGSLDHVSVSTWAQLCNGSNGAVDIYAGDRASFNWITRTSYRMSASPEELGYEPFTYQLPGNVGMSDFLDTFAP